MSTTNITGSLTITETPKNTLSDVYSKAGSIGQVGTFLNGLFPTGRVSGATITTTTAVATIPAGSIFLISFGGILYKLQVATAIASQALSNSDHLYLTPGFTLDGLPSGAQGVITTQGAPTGSAPYASNPTGTTVPQTNSLTIVLGNGASVPSGSLDLGTYASGGDAFTEAAGLNASFNVSNEYSTSVTLTTAQIKALYTTAIQIVPAPAAGSYIDVLDCNISFNPVTTAYTIGSATNLALNYTNKSGTAVTGTVAVTGLLDQTSKTSAVLKPLSVLVTAAALVCISLAGANPTLGDGTLTVTVRYRVVTQ